MTNGERITTIPRANPINAFTIAGIVKDAGLSIKEFKKLLQKLQVGYGQSPIRQALVRNPAGFRTYKADERL